MEIPFILFNKVCIAVLCLSHEELVDHNHHNHHHNHHNHNLHHNHQLHNHHNNHHNHRNHHNRLQIDHHHVHHHDLLVHHVHHHDLLLLVVMTSSVRCSFHRTQMMHVESPSYQPYLLTIR